MASYFIEFYEFGSTRPEKVDVRFVCATNRELPAEAELGHFRKDLYYRIAGLTIVMPPLRERVSDIPELAECFLSRFSREYNLPRRMLGKAALDKLLAYAFPGNVRELQSVILRAIMESKNQPGDCIAADAIKFGIFSEGTSASIAKCGRKLYPEKRIKSYLWSSDMKISPFVLATSVCSILLFGCPNPSSSPTAPTETVTLGTQNGTVTSGTAGSVTFAVTTANIVAGTSGTVSWFTSTAGTTAGSVPTGLTPSVSSVAGDAATITMTASASAMAGQYYFKVVFGSGTSPLATLTIAAIPENLYVVNNGNVGANGSISAFTIGTDGSLTAIASSPFTTGTNPMVVAASPNGKYLYATNMGSGGPNGISAYSIGPSGALTAITSGIFATGSTPYGMAISPNGSCLYVANMGSFNGNNGISAYTIGTGGSLTAIGPFNTGGMSEGIAISPNGNYLYVTNNGGTNANSSISGYSIGAGGSLTTIASSPFVTGFGSQSQWIVISPNGNYLYATNYGNINGVKGISAFTIGTDGSLTAITSGTFDTGNTPAGIAISPNGNYLYVTNYGSTGATGISAYSIGAGGALTAITSGTFGTGSAPASVAVSADGNYLYVANMDSTGANGISAYRIGTGGALTAITSGTFATGPSPATIVIVQ